MPEPEGAAPPEGGLAQLLASRTRKLERLRSAGHEPYPARAPDRTHSTAHALEAFEALEPDATALADPAIPPPLEVRLNGRLVGAIRLMGGSAFVHLKDSDGRLQLHVRRDAVGEDLWSLFSDDVDAGDIVSVTGTMFRTRRGEVSLSVDTLQVLSKSLLPLPEKWHGLQDRETRYRQRYLDLLSNDESLARFVNRSRIVTAMRRFLDDRGFLEVETPILQPLYGGGSAEPFTTEYQALGQTMYLRIADELYLKRLLVGGLEKVYEIGKDFRNEGIDRTHLPEFTQMECYWAYADYTHMMALTEQMVAAIATEVCGSTQITRDDQPIELAPPWRRLGVVDGVRDATGLDLDSLTTLPELRAALAGAHLSLEPQPTWSKTVDKLLQMHVEPGLVAPTFLVDYPVELSPLAKRIPDRPRYVERFEPFVAGMEIGNAFTELNDPLDQRARLEEGARASGGDDAEAHPVDEDFVEALMHGMPPAGGLGIGVDRLVMLLTGASTIRDAVLFPQLRAEQDRPG